MLLSFNLGLRVPRVFCSGTTPEENPELSQYEMGNRGSWKLNSMKSIRYKYEKYDVPFPTFILFSWSENALKVSRTYFYDVTDGSYILLPKHLEKRNKTQKLKP